MPRSRSISSYPESFWKIVEDAATQKQIFEFPFDSKYEAMQLQGKFYGFRGALLKEAGRLGILLPANSPQRLKVEAAARQAQEVVCHVSQDGICRIMHRDQTPEAKMFEEALARAGSKTREQELAESALRFVNKAKEETGGKYG